MVLLSCRPGEKLKYPNILNGFFFSFKKMRSPLGILSYCIFWAEHLENTKIPNIKMYDIRMEVIETQELKL